MSGAKTNRYTFWLELAKLIGAGVVALCTANWRSGAVADTSDHRMTLVEEREAALDKKVDEIHTDVREIRGAVMGEK